MLEDLGATAGVQDGDPLLLRRGDVEVSLANAPVKVETHPLEGIEPAPADALHPGGGVEVKEQGEIGEDPAGGQEVQLPDRLEVEALAVALVGKGRVGVAVGDDDLVSEPAPGG